MSWKHYPQLDESVFSTQLACGLTVNVVPKPGFSRKIAYFATDFGSVHQDFILDGQQYHVPQGVAHFLEHKMFELPGRDVSAEFAALGANVNAFTSFDMTAYYFSCTDCFEKSLRLLLEFVSTPYFTQESVQREMGIIDQEIAMNEDDPGSREFDLLMAGMYRRHPVKKPILGTRTSIRRITPEILHICHRAFYTPANMILCVVGDVDAAEVVEIAESVLGSEYRPAAEKLRPWQEEMTCPTPAASQRMDVAMPSFQIGFKCESAGRSSDTIRTDVLGYFAAEILLGEATELYLKLYEDGIIDNSFGGSFETIDGCAMLTCGGDGIHAEAVKQAILDRAAQIAREGVDEEEFRRLGRCAMGRRLRDLDHFDALCYRLCAYHFLHFEYLNFPAVYAGITAGEVRDFLTRVITPERCTVAVTLPLEAHQPNSTKEESQYVL